jgi:hypothetical protein
MPPEIVLVAPGSVSGTPVREAFGYDRFAAELGDALGIPVRVADDAGDAAVLLLPPTFLHRHEGTSAQVLVIDAAVNDPARVALGGLLGAVTAGGFARWREGEPVGDDALFGRIETLEKMPAAIGVRMGDYAYVRDPGDTTLPALTAKYLRAAGI